MWAAPTHGPGIDHADGASGGAGLGEDFEVDDFVSSEFHGGVELLGAEEFGVHDAGFALHEVVDEFASFGFGGEVLSPKHVRVWERGCDR